jgi:hypothetical protein
VPRNDGENLTYIHGYFNGVERWIAALQATRNDRKIVISNSRFIIAKNKIMKQPKNAIICYCEECEAERSNPANKNEKQLVKHFLLIFI